MCVQAIIGMYKIILYCSGSNNLSDIYHVTYSYCQSCVYITGFVLVLIIQELDGECVVMSKSLIHYYSIHSILLSSYVSPFSQF